MYRIRGGWLLVLVLVSTLVAFPQSRSKNEDIRLIVVFSIDQCRADYLARFTEHYLPARSGKTLGGFQFLKETGAHFRDAHFEHVPTHTGPGHATLLTGSAPCLHGVIANSWIDRQTGAAFYCVDDKSVQTVGGKSNPMSPRTLLVSTVGDELKMATNGAAKVVGIAYKDRAAILMAGHAADTVIWFDDNTGGWITSTFYEPNNRLPEWVEKLNAEKLIDRYFGKAWEPILPDEAYRHTRPAPGHQPGIGGRVFSHKHQGTQIDRSFYRAFAASGFGNDFVFETAKRAVKAEGLGQDTTPDLLVINLSTNDYIGHTFGPNSPEVMDITVRTDRLLSDFFNFLQKQIPGGIDRVVIAVSADHGVVPIPEEARDGYRLHAGRVNEGAIVEAAEKSLDAAFGEGNWVRGFDAPYLFLNLQTVAEKKIDLSEAERLSAQAVAGVQGIYHTFTRTQILSGNLPKWGWTQSVSNCCHPRLSGEVMDFEEPNWYFGMSTSTGHNSPWVYDTHVPLVIRGAGIQPGRYMRRVTTMDLAPTLSQLLGIEYPSGCMGKPLAEAISKH